MVDRSAGLAILGVRDMTPGTSFTGMHVDAEECGGRPHRWFVYWSNGSGNRSSTTTDRFGARTVSISRQFMTSLGQPIGVLPYESRERNCLRRH